MNKRTHIVIPETLAAEIDAFVGQRGRSQFFAEAARKELQRLRMLRALDQASGAWQDRDHPELEQGAVHWVNSLRTMEEQGFKKKVSRSR